MSPRAYYTSTLIKYKTKHLHSPERNIFILKALISFSSEYLQYGFYNLWMKNYSSKHISAINSFLFISRNIKFRFVQEISAAYAAITLRFLSQENFAN